jgi:hypothetical protein
VLLFWVLETCPSRTMFREMIYVWNVFGSLGSVAIYIYEAKKLELGYIYVMVMSLFGFFSLYGITSITFRSMGLGSWVLGYSWLYLVWILFGMEQGMKR